MATCGCSCGPIVSLQLTQISIRREGPWANHPWERTSLSSRSCNLYIDESGELGSKPGSSDHLIIAVLSTESPKGLNKKLKKYKAKLYNDGWPQDIEIKGVNVWGSPHNPRIPKIISDNRESVLNDILSEICASPISISYTVANKSKLTDRLRKADYGIAYNFFCGTLLCRAATKGCFSGNLDVTVDQRSKETHSKMKFDGYIETRLFTDCDVCENLSIKHCESDKVLGLQAVDFLSWSLFRHYEHRDSQFRNLIHHRIDYRDDWYSGKK